MRSRIKIAVAAALSIAAAGCLEKVVPEGGEMLLTLEPDVLDKETFGSITILAMDETGAPVMDGTQVFVTTDLGTVMPYGEYQPGDVVAGLDRVDVGTRNGVARATFFSGDTRGTATIKVKSGKHTLEDVFVIGRTPDRVLVSIVAEDGTSGSVLAPEGGTIRIEAYVYDALDNPVPDVDVVFTTDDGALESGGGHRTTDADGMAMDRLTTTFTAHVTARLVSTSTVFPLESDPVTVTVPTPIIYALVPSSTTLAGGTAVTVTGNGFAYGSRVLFDALEGPLADPDVALADWDEHQMTVLAPAAPYGSPGVVDVTVQNPNGYSYTRAGAFTYVDGGAGGMP